MEVNDRRPHSPLVVLRSSATNRNNSSFDISVRSFSATAPAPRTESASVFFSVISASCGPPQASRLAAERGAGSQASRAPRRFARRLAGQVPEANGARPDSSRRHIPAERARAADERPSPATLFEQQTAFRNKNQLVTHGGGRIFFTSE